ncbi:hypothetical protein BDZ91DRAFT_561926 [Kalaharituber pfeilii]|nr:hypothetical protein BDZ91DRAFT_561926 [Kalaharituber pfeilii]
MMGVQHNRLSVKVRVTSRVHHNRNSRSISRFQGDERAVVEEAARLIKLHTALESMQDVLRKYYKTTEKEGLIYNLACVLDPSQKLDLYKRWDETEEPSATRTSWEEIYRKEFCEYFQKHFQRFSTSTPAPATSSSASGSHRQSYIRQLGEAIVQHGAMDNWTTDVSEALHGACKDAYRSSNRVDYIQQVLDHMDRSIGMGYMHAALVYLATKGYYVRKSTRILELLPPEIRRLNTRVARNRHKTKSDSRTRWVDCAPCIPPPTIYCPTSLAAIQHGKSNLLSIRQAEIKYSACHLCISTMRLLRISSLILPPPPART